VNGILAGVAAGCKCLAITTTSTDDALINAGATMCAKDFSNITIDTLQQML
jgi:beta-phosphoglucomutase-like phosphatase (HAD superfamily)